MIPRTHFLIMLAAVAVNAAVSAAYYSRLPDPSPIHWSLRGEPDKYGSPMTLALMGPALSLGLALLLTGLPLLGPFRKNFDKFRTTYGRIGVTLMIFFLGMQIVMLMAATSRQLRIGPSLCVLIGLMIALLGNWMGKIRRNFYIGIRTPWTLANEVVWEKTHRLGGRLFVVAGVISAATGMVAGDAVCFYVLIGTLVGATTCALLYSLYEYRKLGRFDDLSHEAM